MTELPLVRKRKEERESHVGKQAREWVEDSVSQILQARRAVSSVFFLEHGWLAPVPHLWFFLSGQSLG